MLEQLTNFITQSLLLTWAAMVVLGSMAELVFPAEPGQPLSVRLLNARYGVLYAAFIFALGPAVSVGVSTVAQYFGIGWIDLSDIFGPGIAAQVGAAALLFFITDFFYYWLHRAQHTVPFLWDQHAVHHSDATLNISTSMRHHWTEFMLQAFAITLPMTVFFKLPHVTAWAVGAGFAAWSFFIHCNVRLQLGRWSWVLCGPQLHRIHHSRLAQHADKNFAAYFPVWDRLFGSYFAPDHDEFPPTGLRSGESIEGVVLLAVWPFKAWLARAAAYIRSLEVRP